MRRKGSQTSVTRRERVRKYIKGVDRADVIRRLFALWIAFTLLLSLVPPLTEDYGGDSGTFGIAKAEPYNLSDAKFVRTLDVSGEDTNAQGVTFNGDGTKMFMAGRSGENIYEYTLSDAYNISSATHQRTKDVSSESGNVRDVEFNNDGTKMYVVAHTESPRSVYEYELSETYNISTATFKRKGDISGEDNIPRGIAFNDDGSKLYMTGTDSKISDVTKEKVYEYSLSEAFNVSTLTFDRSLTVASETTGPQDVNWNNDGTKLYVVGPTDVFEYSVSGAYNVSTATFQRSFDVSGQTSSAAGMAWDGGGSNMYVVNGSTNSAIHQYQLFDFNITGTVTWGGNGSAVDGASITVNTSSATDTTDANGDYSLGVDNGTHEVTATKGEASASITVEVNNSDVSGQDITLLESGDIALEVPSHMWQNASESYVVQLEFENRADRDITDEANVTSSDPTNLTVNETSHKLESTSDLTFNGEVKITAEHEGQTVSKNVTVANLSVEHMDLMQNAGDMTSALWGDVPHPETDDRRGGTQLTMRILLIALGVGAAVSSWSSSFGGIGGVVVVVAAGWFMGWVGDGMAMITVFTGLFIGLNVAANIDYSVRK